MDIWSKSKRSEVMRRIRGRDTKPELIVRSLLHRVGSRYSLRRRDLPGRPDLVLPKYQAVIFVNGCFWHRHKSCPVATTPKSRKTFWLAKFRGNVARDRRNRRDLERQGWKVLVVWECEVMRDPMSVLGTLLQCLNAGKRVRYDALPGRNEILKVAEARLQWSLDTKGGRESRR